ncbi:MAG: acetyl-CoA C-acetyltransferase [Rickettsiaceae bacterium]|nr:acetyl-CoA C-acetyltransferase [Rickettsiaceae bacterium]
MKPVYIVDAKRTAVGSFLGSLQDFKAHELTVILLKHLLDLHKIPTNAIDEIIMGQVLSAGQGQNPARQASILSGIDIKTPAFTINKVCGSGLKAIALGFDSITLGDADLIIAGGHESMSSTPHGAVLRKGAKMGDISFTDFMMFDGLVDAFGNYSMGITAENIAEKYQITREEQDEFALISQQKASKAQKNGYFKSEIVKVPITKKKEQIEFAEDEFIRHDSSIESLSKLKPAFKKDGTVTAGNASGINDGSAILILASEAALKKYNLKPIAKMVAHASAGVDPAIMGIGPSEATKKLLRKINTNVDALELIESNEAFAAQSIAVNKLIGWDVSKVNISGGSIAIGHPIGASGARITTTLLHNMQRLKAKNGVATLCIGGGMGIAAYFERI